jgi:hypothetical protein
MPQSLLPFIRVLMTHNYDVKLEARLRSLANQRWLPNSTYKQAIAKMLALLTKCPVGGALKRQNSVHGAHMLQDCQSGREERDVRRAEAVVLTAVDLEAMDDVADDDLGMLDLTFSSRFNKPCAYVPTKQGVLSQTARFCTMMCIPE